MYQSVQNRITDKLKTMPSGSVFFISDFSDLGTDVAIRQALQRLSEKEKVIRLAKGVYYYPKTDKLIGVVKPTSDQIAQAIAKRDKARIIPTGSYALYKLGLTTQVPMNVVYLTDGSARKIQIGNQKIVFKKTSPRNLAVTHPLTALIIQGLKELGEENIDQHHISSISAIINKAENQDKIRENIRFAPVWIQKIVHKILIV